MDNSLLILKRIVSANDSRKKPKKTFNENEKCAITISSIRDKHLGIKPSVIECYSVHDLHEKLRHYLPSNGVPSYKIILDWVKQRGFVQLYKTEINGKITYRA